MKKIGNWQLNNINPYFTEINYPIDRDKILDIAKRNRHGVAPYQKREEYLKWQTKRNIWENEPYAQKVYFDFFEEFPRSINFKPKMYFQDINFQVPFHIDSGSKSGLNFVISNDFESELVFENGPTFKYRSGILNTVIPHSIITYSKRRILFKISSPEPYEDFVKRCKYVV